MKNFKLHSASKPTYKHIGEREYHSIDSLCLQMALKCQNSKKFAKNTFMGEPPSTKMLLGHS